MTSSSRHLIAVGAYFLLIAKPLNAEAPESKGRAPGASKRTTEGLAMLDGRWSGPAWVTAPDGEKYELEQSETVCPTIFGEIRVMEGRGTIGGITRFQAVTILEGRSDGSIAMRAYTPGRTGDYQFALTSDGYQWGFAAGTASYRYRATVAGDRWTEVGETRADPGSAWVQMFRMELRRVATAADLGGCVMPVGPSAQAAR